MNQGISKKPTATDSITCSSHKTKKKNIEEDKNPIRLSARNCLAKFFKESAESQEKLKTKPNKPLECLTSRKNIKIITNMPKSKKLNFLSNARCIGSAHLEIKNNLKAIPKPQRIKIVINKSLYGRVNAKKNQTRNSTKYDTLKLCTPLLKNNDGSEGSIKSEGTVIEHDCDNDYSLIFKSLNELFE